MSQPKVLGPITVAGAAAPALPVTGNNAVLAALVGFALVAAGLLLVRSARVRPARARRNG
ncbi:MAG TPA: LPXTG cell wall anchor domain-containing protein [Planosporangium sp.]|jgi:LPXTG-motif cell wall-anchored protein|nr:LPXTG cell wall anchor domain-containing protein [Planosporangium sp.]